MADWVYVRNCDDGLPDGMYEKIGEDTYNVIVVRRDGHGWNPSEGDMHEYGINPEHENTNVWLIPKKYATDAVG
jgi:hypothetical protein